MTTDKTSYPTSRYEVDEAVTVLDSVLARLRAVHVRVDGLGLTSSGHQLQSAIDDLDTARRWLIGAEEVR